MESYFTNNSGYNGGSVYIFGDEESAANCLIEKNVFNQNFAYLGGAIGFSIRLKNLHLKIKNCYFHHNLASGFFDLSIYKKINKLEEHFI